MLFICPICGFNKLAEPPFDEFDCGSYELCPCCGNEFGYDLIKLKDIEKITKLQNLWIKNGMKFSYRFEKFYSKPEDWKPKEQFERVKIV